MYKKTESREKAIKGVCIYHTQHLQATTKKVSPCLSPFGFLPFGLVQPHPPKKLHTGVNLNWNECVNRSCGIMASHSVCALFPVHSGSVVSEIGRNWEDFYLPGGKRHRRRNKVCTG